MSAPPRIATRILDLTVPGGRIAGWLHGPTRSTGRSSPVLIVLLHGDNAYPAPTYHAAIADDLATETGCHAAALLRPGYGERNALRSTGDGGTGHGDSYTAAVATTLIAAVEALRRSLAPRRTILVGHSGGGAVAAAMAALSPALVDELLLVACPCDLSQWRRHMARRQFDPFWLLPTHSLSPIELVGRFDPRLRLWCAADPADPIVPARQSQALVARAVARGLHAEMVRIPGGGHDLLGHARIRALLAERATRG